MRQHAFIFTLVSFGLVLLSGCSSSSDDGASTTPTATVSGSVFASATSGATVTIKDGMGNQLAGPVTTDSDGFFSIQLEETALGSDWVVRSTGGTFTDEATGSLVTAGELSAFVDAGSVSNGDSVNLTPGTTIIQRLISAGIMPTDARDYFEHAFGFRPDRAIAPVDVTELANDEEPSERRLAGLQAAVFSQLANDSGIDQFELLQALADDLADGELDGENNGTPVALPSGSDYLPADIQARFAHSFATFHGSDRDHSGLDNNQIGHMPQPQLVHTHSYAVRYRAGEDGTTMGKDSFQLEIRDHDGNPVSGRMIGIHPLMNMANGHMHSTAVGHVMEDAETAGTYNADIYYVMASMMAGGESMGWWLLDVCIPDPVVMPMMAMDMDEHDHGASGSAECDGEKATFYPSVGMEMGVKSILKGIDDLVPDMRTGGEMPRNYHIFKDSVHQDESSYHAHVFIAATETMHSFPGLTSGLMLNPDSAYSLMVNEVAVQFSGDLGETWVDAANGHGGGIWAAQIDGMAEKLWVKLSVNGEVKTDDGFVDGFDYIELNVGTMDMGGM